MKHISKMGFMESLHHGMNEYILCQFNYNDQLYIFQLILDLFNIIMVIIFTLSYGRTYMLIDTSRVFRIRYFS